jgi:NAD(P)-dependent dehydrogenase (short-subunit alcohol dehydrogenase family)
MNDYRRPPGKTALVSGATGRVGAAAAIALARRGIAVALLAGDAAAAFSTRDAIDELGVHCRVEACDLADATSVAATVRRVQAAWGRLDIVVNADGRIGPIGLVGDTDPADWAGALVFNVTGAYHVIHAALPRMLAQGQGAIVNLSSSAAQAPRDGGSAWCAGQAALAMLTRSIAQEYGARGIACYGLQPGGVDDAGMQARFHAGRLAEGAGLPPEPLLPFVPPERSGRVIAWLADVAPADLHGQDVSVHDALLLQRVDVSPLAPLRASV